MNQCPCGACIAGLIMQLRRTDDEETRADLRADIEGSKALRAEDPKYRKRPLEMLL